jgi:hypothetical protein
MTFSLFSRATRPATESRVTIDGLQQGEIIESGDVASGPIALSADELKLVGGGDYDPTPKGGWNPPLAQAASI